MFLTMFLTMFLSMIVSMVVSHVHFDVVLVLSQQAASVPDRFTHFASDSLDDGSRHGRVENCGVDIGTSHAGTDGGEASHLQPKHLTFCTF